MVYSLVYVCVQPTATGMPFVDTGTGTASNRCMSKLMHVYVHSIKKTRTSYISRSSLSLLIRFSSLTFHASYSSSSFSSSVFITFSSSCTERQTVNLVYAITITFPVLHSLPHTLPDKGAGKSIMYEHILSPHQILRFEALLCVLPGRVWVTVTNIGTLAFFAIVPYKVCQLFPVFAICPPAHVALKPPYPTVPIGFKANRYSRMRNMKFNCYGLSRKILMHKINKVSV